MDRRGPSRDVLGVALAEPYEGPVSDERPEGRGFLRMLNGAVYQGALSDGRMHGVGEMTWPDGVAYVGDWCANIPKGRGRISWTSGAEYLGDVADGRRHGYGVYSGDDTRYNGQWAEGQRNGMGLQIQSDGAYAGEWRDGRRHGWGYMAFSSGNSYAGMWQNGAFHGAGVMRWVHDARWADEAAATHRIVGRSKAGPLGAFSVAIASTSDCFEIYDGEWVAGLPHGVGEHRVLFHTGNARDIPFELVNRYVGHFHEGKRHGRGVQQYADGSVFEGSWVENRKEGRGTLSSKRGTTTSVLVDRDVIREQGTEDSSQHTEEGINVADIASGADSMAIRRVAQRYENVLRHLYCTYNKLTFPVDFVNAVEVLESSEQAQNAPSFCTSPAADMNSIPLSLSPSERHRLACLRVTEHVQGLAVNAAMGAVRAVHQYTESMVKTPTKSTTPRQRTSLLLSPTSPSSKGYTLDFSTTLPLPTESLRKPLRLVQLSQLQLLCLVRDAWLVDFAFPDASVIQIVHKVLESRAGGRDAVGVDLKHTDVNYSAFVEILVRIADEKIREGHASMLFNSKQRLTTTHRFHFVCDRYLKPLCDALLRLDAQRALQPLGIDQFVLERGGNDTVAEMKKSIPSSPIQKSQRRSSPAIGPSAASRDEGRATLLTAESELVTILNVEAVAPVRGTRVRYQLKSEVSLEPQCSVIVYEDDREVAFAGVVPTYASMWHKVAQKQRWYRPTAISPAPIQSLVYYLPLADSIEQNLPQYIAVFDSVAVNEVVSMSKILRLLYQAGIVGSSSKKCAMSQACMMRNILFHACFTIVDDVAGVLRTMVPSSMTTDGPSSEPSVCNVEKESVAPAIQLAMSMQQQQREETFGYMDTLEGLGTSGHGNLSQLSLLCDYTLWPFPSFLVALVTVAAVLSPSLSTTVSTLRNIVERLHATLKEGGTPEGKAPPSLDMPVRIDPPLPVARASTREISEAPKPVRSSRASSKVK